MPAQLPPVPLLQPLLAGAPLAELVHLVLQVGGLSRLAILQRRGRGVDEAEQLVDGQADGVAGPVEPAGKAGEGVGPGGDGRVVGQEAGPVEVAGRGPCRRERGVVRTRPPARASRR